MDPLEYLKQLDPGTNLCLSGGADGADLQWGMNAGKIGHGVIHWSFSGHRTEAPEQEIVQLTKEQLVVADDYIKRANRIVERSFPSQSEKTNNLLRRNYYQVKDTEAVYAVSEFDSTKRKWSGGTAWAIQMYLDRFIYDEEPIEKCRIFVWCKSLKRWFQWNSNDWEMLLSRPKTPSGIWTGIGSRELDILDRIEIRKVMGTYEFNDATVNAIHPLIIEPKIGDVVYIPESKTPGRGRLDRTGGWARIRQILKNGTMLTFDGMMNDDEVEWEAIRPYQEELRRKFRLTKAESKPDYSADNNQELYWK